MDDKKEDRFHKGAILLVDDEEPIRKVASRMIQKAGFPVMMAADGLEAVEMFRQFSEEIALVLLDLKMPRMSGEEAFHEIRRLKPGIPVILSTGYSSDEINRCLEGEKLNGCLHKPYHYEDLVSILREILD